MYLTLGLGVGQTPLSLQDRDRLTVEEGRGFFLTEGMLGEQNIKCPRNEVSIDSLGGAAV